MNSYDTDDNVFTASQLEDRKSRELEIIKRKEKDYYRCRVSDASLYNEIKSIHKKYERDVRDVEPPIRY